ncbi:MAG TPA: DUF6485 family protein [Patescibacteria group bacterium]|nr:DUF6485 family protein [Patescibacteria group bacterium]
MECQKQDNLKSCPCSYPDCPRKGICCECIAYHRKRGELPACYFSKQAEASYDRSIQAFIKDQNK